MTSQSAEEEIVGCPGPRGFSNRTSGFHDLIMQREDEEEPRKILNENNERNHVVCVIRCWAFYCWNHEPYHELQTSNKQSRKNQLELFKTIK